MKPKYMTLRMAHSIRTASMLSFLLLLVLLVLLVNGLGIFMPWVVGGCALLIAAAYLPCILEREYLRIVRSHEQIDCSLFRFVPKNPLQVYATENKSKYTLYRISKILLFARSLDMDGSPIPNYDYQETGSKSDRSSS